MPTSPSKSPKGSTPNYSRTKRSSVSKAFDNNRLLKDPNATASVGTMADPAATAPDILASGPNVRINMKGTSSLAGPGSSSLKPGPSGGSQASGGAGGVSKIPVSANLASTSASKAPSSKVISGEASKAPFVSNVASGGASGGASKVPSSPGASGTGSAVPSGSKIPSTATNHTGSVINKQSTTILGQSQEVQTNTTTQDGGGGSVQPVAQPIINADGLVSIGTRSGAVAELVLAIISTMLFTGIFIYFVSGKCKNIWLEEVNGYVESAYVFIGMVTSIFLVFHSCFEKGFQAGRGVFGCIIFFVISGAIVINLWGSFRLGYSCVCSCRQGIESAFHKNASTENTILFLMDLMGCICLILILLIASVSHD